MVVKKEIKIFPSDPELTLTHIARLWVKWNIEEITGDEFAHQIRLLLKTKTTKAWDEHLHPTSDPLEQLLV